MARVQGVVKWFSSEKGYGFIRRDNGDEIFVHHSDINGDGFRALRQGETVEFEIAQAEKGPRATNLVRVGAGERGDAGGGPQRAKGGGRSGRGRRGGRRSKGSRPRETENRAGPAADAAGPARKTLAEQIRERLGGRFLRFGR